MPDPGRVEIVAATRIPSGDGDTLRSAHQWTTAATTPWSSSFGEAPSTTEQKSPSALPGAITVRQSIGIGNILENVMKGKTRTIAAIVATSALMVACGDDSNSALTGQPVGTPSSPRTVNVAMVDNAFEPAATTVRPGETIRFTFDNEGLVLHEAIFGDGAVQEEHEAEMQAAGGSHDAMNMDDTTKEAGDMDMDMDTQNTSDMDGDGTDAHDEAGDEPQTDDHDDGDGDGDDADGSHDEPGVPPSVSLEPGEIGEIIMTFDGAWSAGTIIGCHVPGHWAAGMRLDVAIGFA